MLDLASRQLGLISTAMCLSVLYLGLISAAMCLSVRSQESKALEAVPGGWPSEAWLPLSGRALALPDLSVERNILVVPPMRELFCLRDATGVRRVFVLADGPLVRPPTSRPAGLPAGLVVRASAAPACRSREAKSSIQQCGGGGWEPC